MLDWNVLALLGGSIMLMYSKQDTGAIEEEIAVYVANAAALR